MPEFIYDYEKTTDTLYVHRICTKNLPINDTFLDNEDVVIVKSNDEIIGITILNYSQRKNKEILLKTYFPTFNYSKLHIVKKVCFENKNLKSLKFIGSRIELRFKKHENRN